MPVSNRFNSYETTSFPWHQNTMTQTMGSPIFPAWRFASNPHQNQAAQLNSFTNPANTHFNGAERLNDVASEMATSSVTNHDVLATQLPCSQSIRHNFYGTQGIYYTRISIILSIALFPKMK